MTIEYYNQNQYQHMQTALGYINTVNNNYRPPTHNDTDIL